MIDVSIALAGPIVFVVEAALVALLFRLLVEFRSEVRKVDALVAEYVRCRDSLLAARFPTEAGGWRTVDGGAFREAWTNFNRHLETIRTRYRRNTKVTGILLWVLLPLLAAGVVLWALGLPRNEGVLPWLTPAGAALAGGLLWGAVFQARRDQLRLILSRTDGNYLIAPWPTDGGTSERQSALMDKFLPVETYRAEAEGAGEAP